MAISKERKTELLDQYKQWLNDSKAVFLTEYTGLTVKELDELRAKIREAGGEYHIIKNRLGKIAFTDAGLELQEQYFVGSTAVGFAFEDAPGLAKAISEFAKVSEEVMIKGGYLGTQTIDAEAVKALAELPPLPVMRATLLGTLNAPAAKLARILAEPGRQVAAVVKAYAEKDAAAA